MNRPPTDRTTYIIRVISSNRSCPCPLPCPDLDSRSTNIVGYSVDSWLHLRMYFYWFYLMQFQLLSNGLKRFCLVFLGDKYAQHRWRMSKCTQVMAGWLFGWMSELVNEWRRWIMWDSLPKNFCNDFPLELFPTGTRRFSIILCGFSEIVFHFVYPDERLSSRFQWGWWLCSVTEIAIRRVDLNSF